MCFVAASAFNKSQARGVRACRLLILVRTPTGIPALYRSLLYLGKVRPCVPPQQGPKIHTCHAPGNAKVQVRVPCSALRKRTQTVSEIIAPLRKTPHDRQQSTYTLWHTAPYNVSMKMSSGVSHHLREHYQEGFCWNIHQRNRAVRSMYHLASSPTCM